MLLVQPFVSKCFEVSNFDLQLNVPLLLPNFVEYGKMQSVDDKVEIRWPPLEKPVKVDVDDIRVLLKAFESVDLGLSSCELELFFNLCAFDLFSFSLSLIGLRTSFL